MNCGCASLLGSKVIVPPAEAKRLLLEDSPNAEPQIETLFEQGRIASEIAKTAYAFLAKRLSKDGLNNGGAQGAALFIALNGRQGQGKSAVVAAVRRNLDDCPVVNSKWQTCILTRTFACADYRPDDLQDNFDHFLHEGSYWRSIILASIVAFLILFGLSEFLSSGTSNGWTERILSQRDWPGVLLLGIITVFLSPLRHLLRDSARQFRTAQPTHRIVADLLLRIFRRADILIVDDLDRAIPEQQKALLQALNRHRSQFTGVVLVAFDDAPLLEAEGPRRESSELMTKIFDVSFRLSPMNAADAGLLAAGLACHLAKLNPQCRIAQMFREPMVCGALARVFLINGTASARFARKMVNSVYAEASLAELRAPTDLLAKIRLSGIAQHLPVIETELDFLAQGLTRSSTAGIFEEIESRFGAGLSKIGKKRLHMLIEATRHMQPAVLDWMRLLRIWRDDPPKGGHLAPPEWDDRMTRVWAQNDAFVARLQPPAKRLEVYKHLLSHELELYDSKELTANGEDPPPGAESCGKFWCDLVRGLWVFDQEVIALTDQTEFVQIAEHHRSRPLPTLVFSTEDACITESPSELLFHALHDPTNPLDRLSYELRLWAPTNRGNKIWPRAAFLGMRAQQSVETIVDCWPRFVDANARGSIYGNWRFHFGELGRVLYYLPRDKHCLPKAHRDWLRVAAAAEDHVSLQAALLYLMVEPERHEPFWPRETQTEVWRFLQECNAHEWLSKYLRFVLKAGTGTLFDLWMLMRMPDIIEDPRKGGPIFSGIQITAEFFPQQLSHGQPAPEWYYDISPMIPHWREVEEALGQWSRRWHPQI